MCLVLLNKSFQLDQFDNVHQRQAKLSLTRRVFQFFHEPPSL